MRKSAFAAVLHNRYSMRGQLLASFFCKYGIKNRSDPRNILQSIAYQISDHIPSIGRLILENVKRMKEEEKSRGGRPASLESLLIQLIIEPLQSYQLYKQDSSTSSTRMLIIIDALDEIGESNSKERIELLSLLARMIHRLPHWVKVLMTSRPELDIETSLNPFHPVRILHDDVNHVNDLRIFIRSQLHNRLIDNDNNDNMESAVELLLKSGGRFIYIAMLCENNFIGDKKWSYDELKNDLPSGLDEVYLQYFHRIREKNVEDYDSKIRPLLSLLVTMQEPLSILDVSRILNMSMDEVELLQHQISNMFPLIEREYQDVSTIIKYFSVYHKTVTDWLTDEMKSQGYVKKPMTLMIGT